MAENVSASLGWKLADAVRSIAKEKTGRSSGTATYVGTDKSGHAMILLPGADQPTPVQGAVSASAEVGSTVTYSLANGRLSITGNVSDPAVGESKVTEITTGVIKPLEAAQRVIGATADAAKAIAGAAQRVADAVNQNFFADDNGIHVTQVTQEEWAESQAGPNVLINSLGQLFRDGLTNLLSLLPAQTATETFTGDGSTTTYTLSGTPVSLISVTVAEEDFTSFSSLSGNVVTLYSAPDDGDEIVVKYRTNDTAVVIWDGMGNAAGNILASFGEVVRIGRMDNSIVEIDSDEIKFLMWTGSRFQENASVSDNTIAFGLGSKLTCNATVVPVSYFMNIPEGSFPGYVGPTLLYARSGSSGGTTPVYFWNGYEHLVSLKAEESLYASNGMAELRGTANTIYLENTGTAKLWRFYLNSNSNPNIAWSDDGGSTWVSPFVNARDTRTANRVLAAPNGSNGAASFRALVQADIPSLAVSKVPGIKHGVVGQTNTVPAGSYKNVSVSFGHTYSSAPTVVVGLYSSSTAAAIGQCSVAVASASTTGFTARLFNAGSTDRSPGFYWIAIG